MRAVSKLVATIIIVSVAMALSIALALFMSGVVSDAYRLERLDITSGYAVVVANKFYPGQPPIYVIVLTVNNKGTINTTIDKIFINNKPIESYGNTVNLSRPTLPITIKPGDEVTFYIHLSMNRFFHGQMVEVEIHTASGGVYPKIVNLP